MVNSILIFAVLSKFLRRLLSLKSENIGYLIIDFYNVSAATHRKTSRRSIFFIQPAGWLDSWSRPTPWVGAAPPQWERNLTPQWNGTSTPQWDGTLLPPVGWDLTSPVRWDLTSPSPLGSHLPHSWCFCDWAADVLSHVKAITEQGKTGFLQLKS